MRVFNKLMIHKIILSKEDNQGNITYYTTNSDYDHSLLCDLIDDEDIHKITNKDKYGHYNDL